MRKRTSIVVLLAVVLFSVCVLSACDNGPTGASPSPWSDDAVVLETVEATTDFVSYLPDADMVFLNADNAELLLKNPDRGFRMETYITIGSPLRAYPEGDDDPFEYAKEQIEKYKSDSPTLAQVYVYLSNYSKKKKIDSEAFDQLKRYFELFKDNNIRILLRFAYAAGEVKDSAYKYVDAHLDAIGGWIKDNVDLFSDTVYCVQGGIVGLWGEGHSNKRLKDRYIGRIYEKLINIIPERIYVQVRTDELYERISEGFFYRVGMHNDYIIGKPDHFWGFFSKEEPTISKAEYYKRFPYTVNDGEMPWGRAKMDDKSDGAPLNNLSAVDVIKEIVPYYLTSLSLEHNYREDEINPPYSLERWKSEYITMQQLANLGAPYNPNLFKNADGSVAEISVYDYLRYHLGYNLAISHVTQAGRTVSFRITNFGMAAPLNFNTLSLVAGKGEGMKEYKISAYDKTMLQPMSSIKFTLTLPDDVDESFALGVKLATKNGAPQTVRFANDTLFENGVQYILNF